MVYIHHFGTMTHTPGIWNFSAKTPKIANFLVLLAILSNHKTHHISSELAVLLTRMMYYMRLRNVEYYQQLIFLRVHVHRAKCRGHNFLEGTWALENSDS